MKSSRFLKRGHPPHNGRVGRLVKSCPQRDNVHRRRSHDTRSRIESIQPQRDLKSESQFGVESNVAMYNIELATKSAVELRPLREHQGRARTHYESDQKNISHVRRQAKCRDLLKIQISGIHNSQNFDLF